MYDAEQWSTRATLTNDNLKKKNLYINFLYEIF